MRVALCLGCLVVFVIITAEPALAHARDTGAPVATNYRSEIIGLQPDPGSIEVTRIGEGDLRLRAGPGHVVVVHGYGRVGIPPEPYLRIDADGSVRVNLNSPAVWLNEDRSAQADVPSGVDPGADPEWEGRVPAGAHVTQWLDHRIRWVPAIPPEAVREGPAAPQHVSDWEVPLTVDGEPVVIRGTLTWIPDRSPWPAVAIAVLAAVVAVAAGRRWSALGPAVTAVAAVAALVVAGGFWAHPESQLRATALVLPGIALVSAATGVLGSRIRGAVILFAAVLVVVWAIPILDLTVRPVLFTAQPTELVRPLIPAAAGISVGAAGAVLTSAFAALRDPVGREVGRIGRPR